MTEQEAGKGPVFAAAAVAAALSVMPAVAADGIPCIKTERAVLSAEAAGARDGATILLADGREMRLAGIVGPTETDSSAEAARQSAAALHVLVAGRRVSLYGPSDGVDRYGRLVGQAVTEGARAAWVQAALVASGAARVAPAAGVPDCSKLLLTHENAARAKRLGIWSETGFAVRRANEVAALLKAAGRFALVEGIVRRVGESGGRIFLDFGRRYDRDFTVVIPREAQAAFAEAGVDLRGLSGKRIRARGVLFTWGGPALELRVPAALELIGADEA